MKLVPLKNHCITLAVALSALFSAQSAAGQEIPMKQLLGYIGGMLGGNLPNGDSGSSSSPLFGLAAGIRPTPEFGVGFFGTYYGQTHSGSIFGLKAGTETHTTNLCGELNFFSSIFHVGGDFGVALNSWSAEAGNASIGTSKSVFILGPEAGVAVPLGKSGVSAGGPRIISSIMQTAARTTSCLWLTSPFGSSSIDERTAYESE